MAIGNSNKQSYKLPIDKKIDSISIQSLGTNVASSTLADSFAAELINFEPGKGDEWVKRRGTKLLTSPLFQYEFHVAGSDDIWTGPADNSIMFEDNGNLRTYHLKNGVIFDDKGISQDFFTYDEIFNWNLTPSTTVEEGEEDYEKRFQLHGKTVLNRPWKYNENGVRIYNDEYNWRILAPIANTIDDIATLDTGAINYNFLETADYAIWTIGAMILYFPKGSSWSISQTIESDSYYTGCELIGKVLSSDPVLVPDAYNETYNDDTRVNALTDLSTKEGCENLGGNWRYSCVADDSLGQYCSEDNDYYKQFFCEIDTTVLPQDDIENEIMIENASECNALDSSVIDEGEFAFQAVPKYQSKTTITTQPLVDAETGILIRDGSTREAGKVWSEVPPEVINNQSYALLSRINYLSDRPGYRTTTFIPTSISDSYLTPLNDGLGISKSTIYERTIDIQDIELEPIASTHVDINNTDVYINNVTALGRIDRIEDDEYISQADLLDSNIEFKTNNIDDELKDLFLSSGLTPTEFVKENNISSLKVLKRLKGLYVDDKSLREVGNIAITISDVHDVDTVRLDWTDEFLQDKKFSDASIHSEFNDLKLKVNNTTVSDLLYNASSPSEKGVLDNIDMLSTITQGYFSTVENYSIPLESNTSIFELIKDTPILKAAGLSPDDTQRINTYTKSKGISELMAKGNKDELVPIYDGVNEDARKGMYMSDELGVNYIDYEVTFNGIGFKNVFGDDDLETTITSGSYASYDYNLGYGKLNFSPDTRRNFTNIGLDETPIVGYIHTDGRSMSVRTVVGETSDNFIDVYDNTFAKSPFKKDGFSQSTYNTWEIPLLSKHFVTEDPLDDNFSGNNLDEVSENKYIVSTVFQNWVTNESFPDGSNDNDVDLQLGEQGKPFRRSYIEVLDNRRTVNNSYGGENTSKTLRSYGFIDINLNDRVSGSDERPAKPTFRYQTIDSELTPDNKLLTLNIKDDGELVVNLIDIDNVANVFDFEEEIEGVENVKTVQPSFKDSVPNVGFYKGRDSYGISDNDGVTYVDESNPGRGVRSYNPIHFGDNFTKIADLDWMGLETDFTNDNVYGQGFYNSLKIEYIGNNKVMVYQKYNKKFRTSDNSLRDTTRDGYSGYDFVSSGDYNYEFKSYVDIAIIDLSTVTVEGTFNIDNVKFVTKELTTEYVNNIYEQFNNKDAYDITSGPIYLFKTFDIVSNGEQIGIYPVGKHAMPSYNSDKEYIIDNLNKLQSYLPYWTIDILDIGINDWVERNEYFRYSSIHKLPDIINARVLVTDNDTTKTPTGNVTLFGRNGSSKESDSFIAILEVQGDMKPVYKYKCTSPYKGIYNYWNDFKIDFINNNNDIASITSKRIKTDGRYEYGVFLKLKNNTNDVIKYSEWIKPTSTFIHNPDGTLSCSRQQRSDDYYEGLISNANVSSKRDVTNSDVDFIYLDAKDITYKYRRNLYNNADNISGSIFEIYNDMVIDTTYSIYNKKVSKLNTTATELAYKAAVEVDIRFVSFDVYGSIKHSDIKVNSGNVNVPIKDIAGGLEYQNGITSDKIFIDKSLSNIINTKQISNEYQTDGNLLTKSAETILHSSSFFPCNGGPSTVGSYVYYTSSVINLFNGSVDKSPAYNIPNIFTYNSQDLVTVEAQLKIFDEITGEQLYDSGILQQALFLDESSRIDFNSLITYMSSLGYAGISQIGPDNIKAELKVNAIQNGITFELDVNDYVEEVVYLLHKRLGRIPEDGNVNEYITGLLDLNDVNNKYEMIFNLIEVKNILNDEVSYKIEISFEYQQKLKTVLSTTTGSTTGDKVGVRGIVSQLFNDKFNMGNMFDENIRQPMFRIVPVVEAPIIGNAENGTGVYSTTDGVVSFQAIFNSDITSEEIYQVLVNIFDIDNLAKNQPYQVFGIYKELTQTVDGIEVPILDASGEKQYETVYNFNTDSNNGRWQRGIQYDNGVQLTGSGERQFIVDITVPVDSSIWIKSETDLKCVISNVTNDCIRCTNGVCTYNDDGTVNNEIVDTTSEEYANAGNIVFVQGWKPGFLWIEQSKLEYLAQYVNSRIVQFSNDYLLSDYNLSMKRSRDISNNISQIKSITTFDDKIVVAYDDQVYISEGSSPTKFVYTLENIPTHLGNIIKALPFEGSIMLFFERGYCTYTPTSSGSGTLEFASPSNVQETAALISGDTIAINSTYVDMLTKDGVERVWSYQQTVTQEPTLTSTRLSSMITNVLVKDIQKSISTRLFSLEKLTIVKVKVQVDDNGEELYLNRWYIYDNNDDFVIKSTQQKWYVWEGEVLDILNIKQYKDNNGDVRTVMLRADAPEVLQLGYSYKVNSDGTRNETLGTGVRSQVVDVSGHVDRAVKVTTINNNGVENDIYLGIPIVSRITTNPLAASALFDQKWKSYAVELNHFGFEQTYYRKHYVLDNESGDFIDQNVDMSVNNVVYEDGIWKVVEDMTKKYNKASLNSNNTFNTKALFDNGLKDTFAINGEDTGQAAIMKTVATTNDDEITLSDKVSLGSAKGSQFKITIVHDENKPFAFKRIKVILKLKKQK